MRLLSFLSAFVIFTRALSGAGYEESLSLYTLSGGLPTAHTNTSSYTPEGVTLPVNVNEQKAFADHWRRFKKSLRPCAQRSSSLVPKAGMPPYRRGAKKVMLNVECIRERIQSLAPSGNSLVPTIAKEERVFAMSLNTIPRRSKK